jgi:hypothetical protein
LQRSSISVGFADGDSIPTYVTRDASQVRNQFDLRVLPGLWTTVGVLVIAGALVLFFNLAGKTDIIRDTTAPMCGVPLVSVQLRPLIAPGTRSV